MQSNSIVSMNICNICVSYEIKALVIQIKNKKKSNKNDTHSFSVHSNSETLLQGPLSIHQPFLTLYQTIKFSTGSN